ncbi:MAG TPA: HD domain-containing phosphohydrolase [Abditibacteriaceae bacterium]|jgi:HD-GYP domain-containing protein (c-di-GMP phosphodiesterase class II)
MSERTVSDAGGSDASSQDASLDGAHFQCSENVMTGRMGTGPTGGIVDDDVLYSDPVGIQDGVSPVRASSPMQLLNRARTAVLEWQATMQDRLDETQTLLVATEARLVSVQNQVQQRESALNTLRGEVAALMAERDAIMSQRDLLASQRDGIAAERQQIARDRDEIAQERNEIAQERDHWRNDCQRHLAVCRSLQDQLAAVAHRNTNLNTELMELYRDLRAEDLPSLILRIGMKLTGAENGLYVDGSGHTTIASLGMDNLSETITTELHSLTQEAAKLEEPVVRNESDSLPGGSDLVNMAALPVAVQGGVKGVLLVANKRSGPFTEEDTDLLLAIGSHAGIALENHRLHCQLTESYLSTIAVLADAIEAKDPYTRGHCESVAGIAVRVAQKLGWQDDALEHLRYAALLHDIGKIGIPDGILLKPGRLLPEEYQVIQRHTSIGRDLVSRVPSLEPIAATILHHHERIDGSGYPDGLSGEDISLASRIISVVDAFDAMTTPRPYRDPISPQEALEELRRCTGTQFDEKVVNLIAVVLAERTKPNETVEPVADASL